MISEIFFLITNQFFKTIKTMKKSTQTLLKVSLFSLALLLGQFSFGQVVFTSVPDSVAVQSAVYTYNVIAVAAPTAATFSLQTAPSWMSINSVTGVITGTPANLSDGGKVVIKAHNSAGDYFQTYNIYITDAVVCDPAIVAYWPMDNLFPIRSLNSPTVMTQHGAVLLNLNLL